MDKQKQIEEMAKILLETSCKGSECENCSFVKSVKEAEETCVCLKALYNAGYRKIPEGAVVLTREEYEKVKYVLKYEPEEVIIRLQDLKKNEALYSPHMFCSIGGCGGVSKDCNYACPNSRIVQERKETAEKFAEMLKGSLDISVEGYSTSEVINEIEDKIDEICKEIVEGKV